MTQAALQSPRLTTCQWIRCTRPLERPRRRESDALGATRKQDWHPPMSADVEALSVLLTVMQRHMDALTTTRQRGVTFCSVTTLWSRQPSCPRSSSPNGQEMDIYNNACSEESAGLCANLFFPSHASFFFFIGTGMPLLLILYASPWFPGWKTDLLAEELLVHNSPPDS